MIVTADASAILRKGEGRTVKAGGPWVYDNEIARTEGTFSDGDIVSLLDHDGFFLGYGCINTRSKIRLRMLSRRRNEIVTEELITRRVRDAWALRKRVMRDAEDLKACRMLFGEADDLPGFTVDRFGNVLVAESLALGTDRMKTEILDACRAVLAEDGDAVSGIYERSDAKVRELEGLERHKGFIGDPFDTRVEITENGIRYLVDVENGQKTGFFLDQKYNRQSIRGLCAGARVLDCFTHTGSFALNAAAAGASSVLAIDASDTATAQASENAALNGFDRTVRFETADVFERLPELYDAGERYDVVILDPPAFTKSRASVKKAVTGYREINLRGMRLINNGGFLATCSCSHYMEPALFAKTVQEAARGAHKRLRQVHFDTQAPDHPILWTGAADTEMSYYLKFYIFQVTEA